MNRANLEWRRAATEFVVIVLGVLVALAIDQWNNDRLDRLQEIAIIERLIEDLETDLERIEFGLSRMPQKKEVLRSLAAAFAVDERPSHPLKFLQDVIAGSGYGWNQARAQRTTYEELVGSGRIGIIRNPDIRTLISSYYSFDFGLYSRIADRETQYPPLSYQLVPRDAEYELSSNLSPNQASQLVDAVYASELPRHTIAELNLAIFIDEEFSNFRERCLELTHALDAYLDDIN